MTADPVFAQHDPVPFGPRRGRPPLPAPPISLTPLIGREREVALALQLLHRPEVRLLTLTGPGGIGKTRLALQLAAELSQTASDQVLVVPLATVPQPDLVAATLAEALALGLGEDIPLAKRLAAALRDAALTLVLDNFEHLLDAAPLLSELLATCPGLTCVVTSRTLLRLAGEYVLPVPPLAVPDPTAAPTLAQIAASTAAQLFVVRASAASGNFALTDTTAPVVADICRRLDGVPLAIELAAARVRHLPLALLRDRLEQQLPLLVGGPRDRPLRLQTMRAAIAWSYDALSAAEQRLLNHLAVFVGGWTLEAAEAVCGPPAADNGSTVGDAASLLERLTSLVDQSLVQYVSGPERTARYMMLEPIREFAAERLATSGETAALSAAHAAYFLDFAEHYPLGPFLPADKQWLDQLDTEYANLRAALIWLEAADAAASFARLAAALGWFWFLRGHLYDGYDWLRRAIERGEAEPGAIPAQIYAKICIELGMILLAQGQGDLARSEQLMADGLALARTDGDGLGETQALIGLGALATIAEAYDRATLLLEEALPLAQSLPDRHLAAAVASHALSNLGVAAHGQGRLDEAFALYQASLAAQQAAGDVGGEMLSLEDSGDVARDRGDAAHAAAYYARSLRLAYEYGAQRVIAEGLENVAGLAAGTGHAQQAARYLAAAEQLRELTGNTRPISLNRASRERTIASTRASLGEAAWAAAWAAGREEPPDQTVAAALSFAAALPPAAAGLTPRELEVLRLLACGEPDRHIAVALFVGVRTVEHHVARILAKLDVHTRADAVTAARAIGLLAPSSPLSG